VNAPESEPAPATAEAAPPAPPKRPPRVVLMVRLGALAMVALLAVATTWLVVKRPAGGPLPVLGDVPAFSMKDQRARPMSADSLKGEVSIVDFFFTSCTASCPRLMGRMADVEKMLAAKVPDRAKLGVRLVSFTVDPENDTPEKLAEYAKKYHADPDRWWFLTGEADALQRVVVDGFKVHYQKADPSMGIGEIMHGNWFLLVDARGKIRGYYLSDDPKRVEELVADAVRLAQSPS
jgi:protein SCO1/2